MDSKLLPETAQETCRLLEKRGVGAPDRAYADWSFSGGLKVESPCVLGLSALMEAPNRRTGAG